MQCSLINRRFESSIGRNERNGVYLLPFYYLIIVWRWSLNLTLLTICTNCPNLLFTIDWLIYRLFVLNMGWKHDFLQMMLIVYVCRHAA
jgi:hypothetical protein